ncbi:MAG: hypothetical protein ACRENB_02435 [Gemmatimonadales bacterium]
MCWRLAGHHHSPSVLAVVIGPVAQRAGRRKLLYLMVAAQGLLGYGLTSVIGAIPAEIFEGRHYGTIFGVPTLRDRRRERPPRGGYEARGHAGNNARDGFTQ